MYDKGHPVFIFILANKNQIRQYSQFCKLFKNDYIDDLMEARMKYSREKLTEISETLNAMPTFEKQTDYNKKDAVRMLAKDIEKLRKRGYSFEAIAEKLSQEGLTITTTTLRSYLQSKSPVKKQEKSGTAPAEVPITKAVVAQQNIVAPTKQTVV
ncbi:hypothetical protein [uncultured Deefgea sp.]|uniref:hypothetical protein n=1 Tax=uncultured Deefgea sp. TaxID=1304914 RepID=UPI002607CD28|nr:hypothetical protein [uncultured Deefgea sp.]